MGNGHGRINAEHHILTASTAGPAAHVASVAPLAQAHPHTKASLMIDQHHVCFSQHVAAAKAPALQSEMR